jgi:hypothetical protein
MLALLALPISATHAATELGSEPIAEPDLEAIEPQVASGVLRRKEVPPSGVEEHFNQYSVFSVTLCGGGLPVGPEAPPQVRRFEVGTSFPICLTDAFGRRDLSLELQRPDGSAQAYEVPFRRDYGTWDPFVFAVLPGTPLGTYSISIRGDITDQAQFQIIGATKPHWTVTPARGQPGTSFRIGVAGLAPSTTHDAYLYRFEESPAGQRWEYLTGLPVRTDARGQALVELETQRDEPLGRYRLTMPGQGLDQPVFTLLCPPSGCTRSGPGLGDLLDELPIAVDPGRCQDWTSDDERRHRAPDRLTAFDFGATAAVQCDTDDLPNVRQVALFAFADAAGLASYWEYVMQLIDADPGPSAGWPERVKDCRTGTPKIMATPLGQMACWRVQPANSPGKIRWTEPEELLYGVLDWRSKSLTGAYAWWEDNVLGR